MRVLLWILDRCDNKVGAKECAIGYVPNVDDIDITGLDMSKEDLANLLTVDANEWIKDVEDSETGIKQYFAQFGDMLPKEMAEELERLEANLKAEL